MMRNKPTLTSPSRRTLLLSASAALLFVLPVVSQAAKPPKPPPPPPPTSSVTITATSNPITFGSVVTISGKLTVTNSGVTSNPTGASITLEQDPYPYTTPTPLTTVGTVPGGTYSFSATPTVNTEYFVKSKTKPTATSTTILVLVRTKVSFHLSTTTPKIGARVKFSGSVAPPKNGQLVLIQRKNSLG